MKKILLFFLSLFIALASTGQSERQITILHTNDLHSRLTGFSPEQAYSPMVPDNDRTSGGFARIASIIKAEKAKTTTPVIVVDAGDFTMGTLFTPLEPESGFQLPLMKKMGYDIAALGNHEYDYGLEKLSEIIRSSAKNGAIPSLLAGNVIFDKDDGSDDIYEELFADSLIVRTTIILRDGVKIGFFSILGKDAVEVAPKAAPLKFEKQSASAAKMVKQLRSKGCDVVICISHSGIEKDRNGEWTGEDLELAKKVKGIDLIIGGHSHSMLEAPLMVNGTPIVQTGEFGRNVGKAVLSITNGSVELKGYDLIPVDDRIMGDNEINSLIEAEIRAVGNEILLPLGLAWARPVAETDFTIEGNDLGDYIGSNLGPFVADAIHYYVNKGSASGTDLSMVAAGMLFDRIVPGIQTAPDLFRVMSLGSGSDKVPGYALSRLYVTGRELKNILEILQVAYKSSPDNYCYYSGIRVDYDPAKGLLRKIKKIGIIKDDGRIIDVDFSKKNRTLYSVTANSYMLQFIGIIKKSSFGLINVVPKDASGKPVTDMKKAVIDIDDTKPGIQEGKEWIALIDYLSSMTDKNGNGIPDIDSRYSVAVRSFFPVTK